MAGYYVFYKIDLRSGFRQITHCACSQTHHSIPHLLFGSFQWPVMPLGICNAPSTLQKTKTTYDILWLVYIVIFLRSDAGNILHLREVLVHLRLTRLFGRLFKFLLVAHEIEFCGFIIGANGVRTKPDQSHHNWHTFLITRCSCIHMDT